MPKVRTTTYTRAGDGQQLARVTVYLPKGAHRELKVRCAGEGRAVSDVVAELVSGWLARGNASPGTTS